MNENVAGAQAVPESWHPAGFWIRLAADFVDSLIVYFPATLVTSVFMGAASASRLTAFLVSHSVGLVVGAVYYTTLTARTGQTWGKKIFDLKVVNDDGTPLDDGKSFLRWCAYLASYATLCVGFMMAGWNTEKKALHDYIVGTRVVRKGPASAAGGASPWKIAGVIAAVGFACVALLTGAIYFYISSHGEEMRAQGKAAVAEGKAFGENKSQDACLTESVSRLSGAGFTGEVLDGMFLEGCLPAAALTPGLCDGVPPKNSILATVGWRIQRCDKFGRANDQPCSRLMDHLQSYCLSSGGK